MSNPKPVKQVVAEWLERVRSLRALEVQKILRAVGLAKQKAWVVSMLIKDAVRDRGANLLQAAIDVMDMLANDSVGRQAVLKAAQPQQS